MLDFMLGPYELNQIYTGDARVLSEAIPDESVDLIFTDPEYDKIEDYAWLAKMAARVLKPGKSVLCYIAHHREIQVGIAMSKYGLLNGPTLQDEIYSRSPGRLFQFSLQCNLMPIVWFSKGNPDNEWMYILVNNPMVASEPITGRRYHKWGKNTRAVMYRMAKFTNEGDVILDPFCGSGVMPVCAKMIRRNYLAFEIDDIEADKARERVASTKTPFPISIPKQIPLLENETNA